MTRPASSFLVVALLLLVASPVTAQEPVTWSVAVVIVGNVDADCNGTQVVSTTTPAMHAAALAETAEAVGLVNSWSAGAVALEVTISEQSLTSLTPVSGLECWPAQSNVVLPSAFDSVLVLWPAPPVDPVFGAGPAGRALVGVTAQGTYGSAVIPDSNPYWDHDLSEVMVHEWLHGSLSWVSPGFDLHTHGAYGYAPDDPAWYTALMGGTLPDCAGITADEWAAAGTPTAPGTPISSCTEEAPAPTTTPTATAAPVLIPDTSMILGGTQ